MRQSNWWAATSALVLCGLFLNTNANFGGEKTKSETSNSSAASANEQGTHHDQQADQSNRSDDDNVRYHAVLGVSLTESDGRVSVIAVAPGSPAARGGVRVGDEIRYVDDQRIRTAQGLVEEIREYRPGSQVDLSIRRNGERQILKVKLGSSELFQSDRRPNRAQGAYYYSYAPNRGQMGDPQQQLIQQVRALQKQVSRLQEDLDELRSSPTVSRPVQGMDATQWQRLQRHGEANDDPALFQ